MKEATLVYPHQLFKKSPALTSGRPVYLVEEPLLLTHNPIHRQKLMLHKLSMDAYERDLVSTGYTVHRLSILEYATTKDIFARLKSDGITTVHIVDTTDTFLERAIATSEIDRVWYESPLFILPKDEAVERFTASKKFMARFYRTLREDKNILVESDGFPTGGQWSFDEENRKKIPKGATLPADIQMFGNEETVTAETWVANVPAEQYGETGAWLPYTHEGADAFLKDFFATRFEHFGAYEDAITTEGVRLWHSAISPLMNIGLLTPQYVLDEALRYAKEHDIPLNSLEGFVRQILGWREFMRASYECDGSHMRNQNFFTHTRPLPDSFWNGTTSLEPFNSVTRTALKYGYTHHIERLMVAGNCMLLSQIHPTEVYAWFMGMYIDAYDWVMVPNVYGMSQFADGGSFATKPYISGSNYLRKMSNYPAGDWEATWTALYWNFIATHEAYFTTNHRLAMMPRLLAKMPADKKQHFKEQADTFFKTIT